MKLDFISVGMTIVLLVSLCPPLKNTDKLLCFKANIL